jgi:hypothetical protein
MEATMERTALAREAAVPMVEQEVVRQMRVLERRLGRQAHRPGGLTVAWGGRIAVA